MNRISNTMIRASAGTGKTYQLTNRFIQLLLYGAAPERIIALTFTRKAAGEFFEGILHKLAKAAGAPAEAAGQGDQRQTEFGENFGGLLLALLLPPPLADTAHAALPPMCAHVALPPPQTIQ